ncbi:GTP-binding protein [Pseudoxanthomonas suwonensis]|uniref:GTP-binding protein n=1 Tax=Pseudoxanthomonas suwonensis TaxID=314722 RepID=UPI0004B452CE|nr:ATP/GTP-binding protein [Pseudoxanthomonas suwonensis]
MTKMKLAFLGEPGSGKTTCIAALSDTPPVDTDVGCTDELAERKATTTVAMDFGVVDLGEHGRLDLYGLPGQSRFRFMFEVVRSGLVGVVLLVDASSPAGLDGFEETLRTYASDLRGLPCVVALNRSDDMDPALPDACRTRLQAHRMLAPVIRVDARRREDAVCIAELILTMLTYNERVAEELHGVE